MVAYIPDFKIISIIFFDIIYCEGDFKDLEKILFFNYLLINARSNKTRNFVIIVYWQET